MAQYKAVFEAWVRRNKVPIVKDLADVSQKQNGDFHAGEMVMYTNEFGCTFGPVEILAFRAAAWNNRCVYLDFDSYWFPVKVSEIKHANN